jgi:RNA polymerase subunit RPABC4/transcription elongation factor Spt4
VFDLSLHHEFCLLSLNWLKIMQWLVSSVQIFKFRGYVSDLTRQPLPKCGSCLLGGSCVQFMPQSCLHQMQSAPIMPQSCLTGGSSAPIMPQSYLTGGSTAQIMPHRRQYCPNHASQEGSTTSQEAYCPNHALIMPHRRQYCPNHASGTN